MTTGLRRRRQVSNMSTLLRDTLFETSGQGPPPTKDFFCFQITQTEVVVQSLFTFNSTSQQSFNNLCSSLMRCVCVLFKCIHKNLYSYIFVLLDICMYMYIEHLYSVYTMFNSILGHLEVVENLPKD